MKLTARLLQAFTVLALASCGRVQESAPATPPSSASEASDAGPGPCPLGIEGLQLAIDDAEGGVVIAFSAPANHRQEVRQRVEDASKMHGAGSHAGKGHDGGHFGSQLHGLRLATLPPATATVEQTDDGAKLRLVAIVPEQVAGLREQARERVAVVSRAPCTR